MNAYCVCWYFRDRQGQPSASLSSLSLSLDSQPPGPSGLNLDQISAHPATYPSPAPIHAAERGQAISSENLPTVPSVQPVETLPTVPAESLPTVPSVQPENLPTSTVFQVSPSQDLLLLSQISQEGPGSFQRLLPVVPSPSPSAPSGGPLSSHQAPPPQPQVPQPQLSVMKTESGGSSQDELRAMHELVERARKKYSPLPVPGMV